MGIGICHEPTHSPLLEGDCPSLAAFACVLDRVGKRDALGFACSCRNRHDELDEIRDLQNKVTLVALLQTTRVDDDEIVIQSADRKSLNS